MKEEELLTKISQGAEAILYESKEHPFLPLTVCKGKKFILKVRPSKGYRHPVIDAQLTRHRTVAEARLLHKLFINGLQVPYLLSVDASEGKIWMEKIDGDMLKVWIWDIEGDVSYYHHEGREQEIQELERRDTDGDGFPNQQLLKSVLTKCGEEIGRLHVMDVIHGDLTTSNIILRGSTTNKKSFHDLEPVLIDFGLGAVSTLAEDKAVDLYVLERAFSSTHPVHADQYTMWVLQGYVNGAGKNKARPILKKLEDVRIRGRKRSMVG